MKYILLFIFSWFAPLADCKNPSPGKYVILFECIEADEIIECNPSETNIYAVICDCTHTQILENNYSNSQDALTGCENLNQDLLDSVFVSVHLMDSKYQCVLTHIVLGSGESKAPALEHAKEACSDFSKLQKIPFSILSPEHCR